MKKYIDHFNKIELEKKIVFSLLPLALLTLIFTTISIISVSAYTFKASPNNLTQEFTVSGNKILDPQGREFIVKGTSSHYSTFMAHGEYGVGNEYSDIQYERTDIDFNKMQELGINTVRIFVSPSMYNENLTNVQSQVYKDRLNTVVSKARQRNFVVILTNSYGEFNKLLDFNTYIANTFKSDPYVWITPSNEWRCADRPDDSLGFSNPYNCENWALWKQEHDQFIQAIRNTGFNNPILVNTTEYSWNFSEILNPTYKLTDSQNKIIYGAHRYGNNNTSLCSASGITLTKSENQSAEDINLLKEGNIKCGVTFGANDSNATIKSKSQVNGHVEIAILWAKFTNSVPIIADEVGGDNGPGFQNNISWNQSFINDFAKDWVLNKGGDGLITYTWMWSDKSSLVTNYDDFNYNSATFLQPSAVQLTAWGSIFINGFISQVPTFRVVSTPVLTVAPTIAPTSISTVSPTIAATPTANKYKAKEVTKGSNLLQNNTFINNTSNWSGINSVILLNATETQDGTPSLEIRNRTANSAGPSQDLSLSIVNNSYYTAEVWVKAKSGTINAQITLEIDADTKTYYTMTPALAVSSNQWVKLTGTSIISWNGVLKTAKWYVETKADTSDFYIDNASFLKGEGILKPN